MKNFKRTYNTNIVSKSISLLLIILLHLSGFSLHLPGPPEESNLSKTNVVVSKPFSVFVTTDLVSAGTLFKDVRNLLNSAEGGHHPNSAVSLFSMGGEEPEKQVKIQLLPAVRSGELVLLRLPSLSVDILEKSIFNHFILSHLRTIVLLN